MTTQEQRWAIAERSLDVQAARRMRRTPAVLIAITGLLVIAVASTAVVDLRRLHTPRGAALAWVEASTFGNCHAYLSLSRPVDPTAPQRNDDDVCVALRAATAKARTEASRIALVARAVHRDGDHATATIEVRGPHDTRSVHLNLFRRGDRWLVLRDDTACADAGCY